MNWNKLQKPYTGKHWWYRKLTGKKWTYPFQNQRSGDIKKVKSYRKKGEEWIECSGIEQLNKSFMYPKEYKTEEVVVGKHDPYKVFWKSLLSNRNIKVPCRLLNWEWRFINMIKRLCSIIKHKLNDRPHSS